LGDRAIYCKIVQYHNIFEICCEEGYIQKLFQPIPSVGSSRWQPPFGHLELDFFHNQPALRIIDLGISQM